MKNLDIENKNEFIRKSNVQIYEINNLLTIIRRIYNFDDYIPNAASLYFEKILKISEFFNQNNSNYFEKNDDLLNKMIDNYLFDCVLIANNILKKILLYADKLLGKPFGKKMFEKYFNNLFNEYMFLCMIIDNFTIEKDFCLILSNYLEKNLECQDDIFTQDDCDEINKELYDLGIQNLSLSIEKKKLVKSKK